MIVGDGSAFKGYYQSSEWTCGPACVLSIRNTFEDFMPNQDIEMDVWEKTRTNKGKLAYTTHPRLARYLMDYQYKTMLWHPSENGFQYRPSMKYWDFHERMKYYNKYWLEAEKYGMSTKIDNIDKSTMFEYLNMDNCIIILLTKLSTFGSIFHHKLAVGLKGDQIMMFCPMNGVYVTSFGLLNDDMCLPYGKGALVVWRANA